MDKLDMFQSIFEKNRLIRMVEFRRNFSRYRYAVYLHVIPVLMSKLWCSDYISSSSISVNERTSRSAMENVMYDSTVTYGTYASFGSLYSLCINLYDRSYFPGTTNQIIDK